MSELLHAKQIETFTENGYVYGAISNFRRWQRPKKPNAIHPLPDEFRTYVGLEAVSSEPDPPSRDQSTEPNPPTAPPNTETAPVNEGGNSAKGGNRPAEGGGRRKEVGGRKEIPILSNRALPRRPISIRSGLFFTTASPSCRAAGRPKNTHAQCSANGAGTSVTPR